MVDTNRVSRYAAGLAILFLAALLLVPFLFERHTSSLRRSITASLEPAQEASGNVRLAFAREVGAIRGFLLTANNELLSDYRTARSGEAKAFGRLAELTRRDSATAAALRNLEESSEDWNALNGQLAAGSITAAAVIARLPDQQSKYLKALDDSELLNQSISRSMATVRQRIGVAERRWAWASAVLALLAAGAAALVIVMLRTTLRETILARTDPLTGLHNRRGFAELAQRELSRVRRTATPTTLISFDLDGFKAVNDQRGHDAGDRILQIVGRALRDATREIDLSARLGGDEFAALLSDNMASPPEHAIERIRAVIMDRLRRENCPVTLSIGAVTVRDATLEVDELIRQADGLMYQAKSAGKNSLKHMSLVAGMPVESR